VSLSSAEEFDAYKTLQVDPEADPEVIQAAYRRLAQKWHPDVASGPEAEARMVAINRAWELLADPTSRATYDRQRAADARSHARAAGQTNGPATGPATASSSTEAHGARGAHGAPGAAPRPPESVSRDWTSGRSTTGYGYDESMRSADGTGAAGPPPGNPSGSVLNFGRYAGWSLGEIGRHDLEYVEWLDRMPIGRPYRDEIDGILRRSGRRTSAAAEAGERRGLYRRR
jgi:curved DNA-binding protein CbpA